MKPTTKTLKDILNQHEEYNDIQHFPIVSNFLQHLSSPTMAFPELNRQCELNEAANFIHPDDIKATGLEHEPSGNIYQHLRNGFTKAFPENETHEEHAQKTKESLEHYQRFMHERGGYVEKTSVPLLQQNSKTALSSGVGVNTIGLSLAPHTSSGYKYDICPRASKECRENCLAFTAGGNKQYPETSFRGKLLRHQYLHEHPEHAARVMSHDITTNEKWCAGNGYKSGVRLNVTSDLPWEHLMPSKFFEKHKETQFYDYTKIHGRLNKKLPENYSLALSHTGTGHEESNDTHVIATLENGGVVALVHQRGKHVTTPTHIEDVQTGKRYPIVNGDEDDNVYDRHQKAGIDRSHGVVSGLQLKGVKNEAAGHFANPVDDDGVIRINRNPKRIDFKMVE